VLYVVMAVVNWKFALAILPLIIVLAGMVAFKLSGATMAVVGWVLAVVLAVAAFHTDWRVAMLGSAEGLLKSLGIGVAVVATMWLIFYMKEDGLLATVSTSLKRIARTKEDQALFIGIGFGAMATSLGLVTPSLFPPLMMAMGFGPFASVVISVLGYNASTSFALLSIPITLPADVSGGLLIDAAGVSHPFTGIAFAYKICLYLPVVSVAISFAMLYMVGGMKSVRKGAVQAFLVGLSVAFSCLGLVAFENSRGVTLVPLRVVGVAAGGLSMVVLYCYMRLVRRKDESPAAAPGDAPTADTEPIGTGKLLKAFSPLIIVTVLAAVVGVESVSKWLNDLPGTSEQVHLFSNIGKFVDLNVLSQIYTWIFVAIVITIALLRPKREVLTKTTKVWFKRIWSPFMAYSVYFAIAYVMAYSAMTLGGASGWKLIPTEYYSDFNMNGVLAAGLAAAFGAGYLWIASSLGLFGAVVGGSETGSNVLFMKIQYSTLTSDKVGLTDSQFLTAFGGHAAAGGVASAITPSKINNAVVTIGEGPALEADVMRKLLVVTVLITVIINLLTGLFVKIGL
jgi:lactate permease